MSVETVRKHWQKVQQEPALQQQLAALRGQERPAVLAAVVQIAAEVGFAFTAAEYEAAVQEKLARQHAAGALSEEQLEQIAAGAGGPGSVTGCGFTCNATG